MKAVVVTNGNVFARVVLTRVIRERSEDIAGIVVITGIKANKSRLRSVAEIWHQSGWHYFLFKLYTYLVFAIVTPLYPARAFFVPGLAKLSFIPVIYGAQVNSAHIVNQIRAWEPDLLISVSCPQRIRRELLSVPTNCAINIHSSLLPSYAGIAPYVWVLAQGETTTGTTVHVMQEEFDTGEIIVQKKLQIESNETAFSLFFRLSELGSDALAEAVAHIARGAAPSAPQDPHKRTYYSWPTAETITTLFRNGHRLWAVSDYLLAIRSMR